MKHRKPLVSLSLALGTGLALAATGVPAVEADWSIKLKAGGLSEDARDLGTNGGDDIQESYVDVQPQLLTHFSPNFAHFIRVQGFVPSGMVTTNEYDETVPVESYAALREFWIDIGGITDYPGEVLRLGLQRVREPDGLWYDRDIESARWIFDTTLFQFQLGAAKAFDTYRTDNIELPESQRDRAYGFMGISTQWVPRNFVGARAVYATDQEELPGEGSQMRLESTTTDPATGNPVNTWDEPEARDYGWVGAFLDNRFFEWERGPGLAYRVELMGLVGDREHVVVDPDSGQVTGQATQDVNALAGDAGLRVRFGDVFPLTLGGAYAYGEGGSDANGSHQFRQTGLQSNRSRFTGTRTMINRFNEALQADLTNLRVFTAFLSLPLMDWDFSAVGHRFERDDPSSPVYTDGIDARPDPNSTSTDLGTGWDVVLSYHFDRAIRRGYVAEDDTRSNVRLRASQFLPGEAYGADLQNQTRVVLEGTLWF
jgi:alginate production protein